MIVKQSPEDFRVEELTDVRPDTAGPFAFYRLEKIGWTTPDALASIRQRWQIVPDRLSYGGLKDRHAHTFQYLTILHGPHRKLTHQRITLDYLGQVHEPFTSHHIRANRFALVLRDMSPEAAFHAEQALSEVATDGVPNYFDDQRFGSVRPGEPFIARALIDGQFETALQLALTGYYEFDRAPQKKEKVLLKKLWGDWPRLMDQLPRGHARSLVSYLVGHPDDFRGTITRLRPELRGLYLSAYQSHLWNRILARWVDTTFSMDTLVQVKLRLGHGPMPRGLDATQLDRFRGLSLPLPSSRTHLAEDDPLGPLVNHVLTEEGLTMDRLQVKGIREIFFSKGERSAHCQPANTRWAKSPDETRPGKTKIQVAFDLPRGAYATLIVKRATMERTANTDKAKRKNEE